MGDYTGLRVDVVLKPEFVPVIEYLMSDERRYAEDPYACEPAWEAVAGKFPQYAFLRHWSMVPRADFIPFGALAYMPWDDADPAWQHRLEGDRWVFQCSLKNYDQTIETFLKDVLSLMAKEVNEVYHLYEYNDQPTYWNGK